MTNAAAVIFARVVVGGRSGVAGRCRMGKERVFALIHLQLDLIKKFCFGTCGNILVGVLVDEEIGEMFPCKTEDCPYEVGRLHLGECMDGDVWVRKLADVDIEVVQGAEKPVVSDIDVVQERCVMCQEIHF